MNEQQAFDKVWKHFIEEKNPAAMEGHLCTYFDPKTGAKCAVGCLLTDEVAAALPRHSVRQLVEEHRLPQELMDMDVEFLRALQHAHDLAATYYEPKEFHGVLKRKLELVKIKMLP